MGMISAADISAVGSVLVFVLTVTIVTAWMQSANPRKSGSSPGGSFTRSKYGAQPPYAPQVMRRCEAPW